MRLGILTDIHLSPPGSPPTAWHNPYQLETVRERLVQSIRFLEAQGAERIAVLGDLTHHGDEPSLREAIDLLATANVPVWVLPGNHDLTPGRATLDVAIAACGGRTVTALGDTPVPFGDAWQVVGLPIRRSPGGPGFEASSVPDPVAWDDGPVLVLSHFPVLSLQDECARAGLKYAGDLANANEVAAMLARRAAPTFVINGHLHIRHVAAQGSMLQAACGAQVDSLFEATLVDLGDWDQGRVRLATTPIRETWPGVSPALTPPDQIWTWDSAGWRF